MPSVYTVAIKEAFQFEPKNKQTAPKEINIQCNTLEFNYTIVKLTYRSNLQWFRMLILHQFKYLFILNIYINIWGNQRYRLHHQDTEGLREQLHFYNKINHLEMQVSYCPRFIFCFVTNRRIITNITFG